jgi:hypothetical protein
MYELPSLTEAVRCVVDVDNLEGLANPRLLSHSGDEVSLAA